MLIPNENGTVAAGMGDIICILKLPTQKYHVAFFEEHPLAGEIKPIADMDSLRLKSKMHHAQGSDTFIDAQSEIIKLREKIDINDSNVSQDIAMCVDDPVSNWLIGNWNKHKILLSDALKEIHKCEQY